MPTGLLPSRTPVHFLSLFVSLLKSHAGLILSALGAFKRNRDMFDHDVFPPVLRPKPPSLSFSRLSSSFADQRDGSPIRSKALFLGRRIFTPPLFVFPPPPTCGFFFVGGLPLLLSPRIPQGFLRKNNHMSWMEPPHGLSGNFAP